MPNPETVASMRRRAGAAAVVAFPLALAASDLVAPSFDHGRALAAAVAAHPGQTWALAGLRMVAAALFIAAIAAVVANARQRGSAVAHVAAVFGVLGALGQSQDAAYQLFVLSLRHQGPAAAGGILTRLDTLAAPLELPLLLAFAVSLVLLAAAAWRSNAASTWSFVVAIAALLAHFAPGPIASLAADLLLIVCYAHIGYRLWTANAGGLGVEPAHTMRPTRSPA